MILNQSSITIKPDMHLCCSVLGSAASPVDGENSLALGAMTITKIEAVVEFNNSDTDVIVELEKDETGVLEITIPAGQTGVFNATGNVAITTEKICLDVDSNNMTTGHVSIRHLITYTQ